jgi:rhomboid family GlyGly-CTERM serine protease
MKDSFLYKLGKFFKEAGRFFSKAKVPGMPVDLIFLLVMIGFCNFHLLTGSSCQALVFNFDKVAEGEIYRLLTHPFVHLSWYHFLLDAGAFLLLYTGLGEKRASRKLLTVGICGGSGLLAPLLFAPDIYTQGLCGLSGIAHGLMAYSGLEMMQDKTTVKTGVVCLIIVTAKSIYEAVTGTVFFSFLLFGLCGIPIAVCHVGGVLGGIMSFLILRFHRKRNSSRQFFRRTPYRSMP